MDDLIRREYAIAVIDGWFQKIGLNPEICVDAIKALPSEQPERKKGNWKDCHVATYKYCCSECKAYHRAMYDYCPTCGADMRGEQ